MKKLFLSIILLMFSQVFAGTLTVYYPAPSKYENYCTKELYKAVTYKDVELLSITGSVVVFRIGKKRKVLSMEMLWEYTDD